MREVEPTVLRVLDVPATSTLPELHLLLQAALGWRNTHLHEFLTADTRFGVDDEDWFDIGSSGLDPMRRRAETTAQLRDLGSRFVLPLRPRRRLGARGRGAGCGRRRAGLPLRRG